MSWHKKDWLTAAGLLGVASAPWTLPWAAGLLGGTAATTAMPLAEGGMGMLATPMAETAMLAPPQIPLESSMLDNFAGSKATQFGGKMLAQGLLNPQQQQPMASAPHPAAAIMPTAGATGGAYGMTPEQLKRLTQGYGSYTFG